MKGLLLKDFLILKNQARVTGVILVLYTIMSFSTNNMGMIGAVILMLSVLMPVTTMAYDEKSHWDKYALVTSVTRKDLVLSRYLFGALCIFGGTLITATLNLILGIRTGNLDLLAAIGVPLLIGFGGIILMSLNLPVLFKFGVEKGRMVMVIFFAIPFVTGMLLKNMELGISVSTLNKLVPYLLPPLAILILIGSASLSMWIYNKKEF